MNRSVGCLNAGHARPEQSDFAVLTKTENGAPATAIVGLQILDWSGLAILYQGAKLSLAERISGDDLPDHEVAAIAPPRAAVAAPPHDELALATLRAAQWFFLQGAGDRGDSLCNLRCWQGCSRIR